MIFLSCSADKQLWYQPTCFSLDFREFGKLVSATGTWTMFKRFCSSLGFLLSLHQSLLTPHTSTQPNHHRKIWKMKPHSFQPQLKVQGVVFFTDHFICGLVSRPRKTPHAIKSFNFTFKPFKFLILAQGTASLVWYHHKQQRCHHNHHLNQKPKTEFLACFTRKFRNKNHNHEGKFYFTCNAHILRLKIFFKN